MIGVGRRQGTEINDRQSEAWGRRQLTFGLGSWSRRRHVRRGAFLRLVKLQAVRDRRNRIGRGWENLAGVGQGADGMSDRLANGVVVAPRRRLRVAKVQDAGIIYPVVSPAPLLASRARHTGMLSLIHISEPTRPY